MWDVLLNNIPLVLTIILALLICGTQVYQNIKIWKEARQNQVNEQVAERQHELDIQNEFKKLHDKLDDLSEKYEYTLDRLDSMESNINDLTESDKNDIRAWIVEQYHKFYVHQGWIDAFSADTIEKRFTDYKKEGGNSYVESLIDRLRSLPMESPHGDWEQR